MYMNIRRSVKEGFRRQRSTNPGRNVYVLDLHHKMPQVDGFISISNKNNNTNNHTLIVVIIKTTLLPYSLNF